MIVASLAEEPLGTRTHTFDYSATMIVTVVGIRHRQHLAADSAAEINGLQMNFVCSYD